MKLQDILSGFRPAVALAGTIAILTSAPLLSGCSKGGDSTGVDAPTTTPTTTPAETAAPEESPQATEETKSPEASDSTPDETTKAVETDTKEAADPAVGDSPVSKETPTGEPLTLKPSSKGTTDQRKKEMRANYHLNKADSLRESKKYEEAVNEYKLALKDNLYKNLGGTLALMGRMPEAEASLRKGLELSPDDWLMWNNLAIVLQSQEQYKSCSEALEKSISLNPPKDKVDGMKEIINQLKGKENKKRASG